MTGVIKQILRSLLGDEFTSWVHAFRFAYIAVFGKDKEIDKALIPRLVKNGDTVIDIGAAGADWTWCLAQQVGNKGHVFAFEADPYYAEVTRKTIALLRLNNVTFFSYGLSDKNETSFLDILDANNKRAAGSGKVVQNPDIKSIDKRKLVPIRLESLDEIAKLHPALTKTTFIKCDVEGYELKVFQGAKSIFQNARPIVVTEVGGASLHGYEDREVFEFFEKRNYHSYVTVSSTGLVRLSSTPGSIPEGLRPNRIMIPKELTSAVTLEEPSSLQKHR